MFEEHQLDPTRHHRKGFCCGEPALDRFLNQHAHQNMRRGVSQTFVLIPADIPAEIAGFYTLAPAQICLADLQPGDAKPLPPYPVPCFRMGRLARDLRWRGQGLGPLLLGLAVQRCLAAQRSVGGYALVVDAKNAAAVAFYGHDGFRPFQDTPHSLYLPLGG
ncbi:GNAT family N-acetyltransferase [Cyanobium sp. T1B-Tous]|uniref:GNAT family N-acetyltransferase n=1 Tax=Cyanobium sp. T1B-Tous TaxID=2823721 RepID=UPI0020CFBBFF|nr:GNAT family N-acetyltransferase [Cyanobium sp. T1B-Tous]MCP9807145.1 GNAT family N-acetyltransferase [Cyanobium sp. T1B-Tous]